MKIQRIDLYKYFGICRPEGAEGYLNAYISHVSEEYCAERKRPAMLVIPGGGYAMRSDRENEPIAFKYLAEGYNCFTLEYSLNPLGYPVQLIEGAMAVAYIKENAQNLGVIKDKVATIGFSAGGHLAGMIATLFADKYVIDALKGKAVLARPDAVILSYPVITNVKTHVGTMQTISRGDAELGEYLSLEKRVTKDSVPAFIWATADDNAVPVESSLKMAVAYREAGAQFELHIFKTGIHGLSLATAETSREGDVNLINSAVSQWFGLSLTWLNEMGFKIIK